MTDGTQTTLLRRMTSARGHETTEKPATSSRALRLAFAKIADETVNLSVTVASVADMVAPLDEVLAAIDEDVLLVRLIRAEMCIGVIGLDRELCAAVVEMQTMSGVLQQASPQRSPTHTDLMLCRPLIDAFLSSCPAAVQGTPLAGWADGISAGDRFENLRAAGLGLNDGNYRAVTLSIELGISERQGVLVLVLPLQESATPVKPDPVAVDWGSAFRENVEEAHASLDVLLHKFSISLALSDTLEVGNVLPLAGCSTSSAKLVAPNGRIVGQAKLGQVNGYRAVRLEAPPPPHLTELPDQARPSVAILDASAAASDSGRADGRAMRQVAGVGSEDESNGAIGQAAQPADPGPN